MSPQVGWTHDEVSRERMRAAWARRRARLSTFWDRVEAADCWTWTSTKTPEGYGLYRVDGRYGLAHRLAYEELVGPIPEGLTIDHLCRNRSCVNPDHLEPVTELENIRRGFSPSAMFARQTHCKRGHPFSVDNTAVNAKGHRTCRICRRAKWRRWDDRRRAAA